MSNLDISNELVVYDAGLQPVSNRFRRSPEEVVPHYPMTLCVNKNNGILRLKEPFPNSEVRPLVPWLGCYEPEDHLDSLVDRLLSLPNIGVESNFGGFSFKDDSTLRRLQDRGARSIWRISPTDDFGISSQPYGVETLQATFMHWSGADAGSRREGTDVFIARHVFEHCENPQMFLKRCGALIKSDGYLVLEIPDSQRGLESGDATLLWEEHNFYFTEGTIRVILEESGFNVVELARVRYALEDVIVCIASRRTRGEKNQGFPNDYFIYDEMERAFRYGQLVSERKRALVAALASHRQFGQVVIFGAGHFAVSFLSIYGVSQLVDTVIDENSNKWGMYLATGDFRISSHDVLRNLPSSLCLFAFNPNNYASVTNKYAFFKERGGRFASIFPGSYDVLTCTSS